MGFGDGPTADRLGRGGRCGWPLWGELRLEALVRLEPTSKWLSRAVEPCAGYLCGVVHTLFLPVTLDNCLPISASIPDTCQPQHSAYTNLVYREQKRQ